jgi:hypothetical protein
MADSSLAAFRKEIIKADSLAQTNLPLRAGWACPTTFGVCTKAHHRRLARTSYVPRLRTGEQISKLI